MPSIEENLDIREVISPQEAKFEMWRNRAGFFFAPLAFLLIYFAPLNLKPEAHNLAAIISVIIILWICESLPMPVTALIGAALCVIFKVAPAKEVFAPFKHLLWHIQVLLAELHQTGIFTKRCPTEGLPRFIDKKHLKPRFTHIIRQTGNLFGHGRCK